MQVQDEIVHDDTQAAATIAGVWFADGAAIHAPGQRRFIGRQLVHAFFLGIDLAPRLPITDGELMEKA
jgi:hypothetical protein